jgi:hypothetical protein
MKQKYTGFLIILALLATIGHVKGQTVVPNGSFENWVNYSGYQNPQYWDTPNQEISGIPLFGTTVVTKSSDHEDGSFSAKLETKHILILPLNIPGFITLGNLTLDIANLGYTVTGGWPISDHPTHLKGFYKYMPQGGDSCLIAVGLFKTTAGVKDTIASGYFSTHDVVNDWTPFSAWIDYTVMTAPDTMNIFALSSAQDTATAGSILYIDNINLDYTVGIDHGNPQTGIEIYQDREASRLLLFYDFETTEDVAVSLYSMTGQEVSGIRTVSMKKGKMELFYGHFSPGVYILNVIHGGQKYSRKFVLNAR